MGMSQEKINQILGEDAEDGSPTESVGHTTGIGTRNVMQRLKNFLTMKRL